MLTLRDRLVAAGLAGALVAFYLPAVTGGDYLYADDYYFRQLVEKGELDWWQNLFTQMGRPLLGLWINLFFRTFDSIGGYAVVRALGLVGTVLFALVGFRSARREGWNRYAAAGLFLFVTTTPGWGVFVGWAACAPYPWSALAAFLAGRLMLVSRETAVGKSVREFWIHAAGALALGLVAVGIYQLTVLFCLLPLILRLGGPAARLRFRTSVFVLGLGGACLGLNLIFVGLVKDFFQNAGLSRDGLVGDLPQRLVMLGGDVFPDVVTGWLRYAGDAWQGAAIALLLVAVLAALAGQLASAPARKELARRVVGWTPVFFVALGPLALMGQSNFPWRMLPPVTAVLAGGVFLLLLRVGNPSRWAHRAAWAALVAYGVLQLGWGAHAFREGLVRPNVRETAAWKAALAERFAARPPRFLYFEPSGQHDGFSALPSFFEYGHGSASYVWIGTHALDTYLDEVFPGAPRGEGGSSSLPGDLRPYALADCPAMIEGWRVATPLHAPAARAPRGRLDHPTLGELQNLGGDWRANWAGAFQVVHWPWILHATLGWVQLDVNRSSPAELVFRTPPGEILRLKEAAPGQLEVVETGDSFPLCEFFGW